MDIREQIRTAISDLPDTEKVIVLSIIMDAIIEKTRDIRQDARRMCNIPIKSIDSFPGHPFYVDDDENMVDLVNSIRKYGMLTPGAVRIKEDGRYELLSGHRRLRACQLAGLDRFRCEVLDLSYEEAVTFMIEANRQRLRLRPTEKGMVYSLHEELNEDRLEDQLFRLEPQDNLKTIGKLKRLDHLIPELKDLVDNGVIALMPAYELSFLPVKLQKSLWKTIEYDQCTPSHSQAIRMRRLNEEGALTPELIDSIMDEIKPNQKDKLVLRDQETIAQIPADIPEYRREEYVAKALRLFRKIGGK